MPLEYENRRKRVLTDDDIEALREVLKQEHECKFSGEEIQSVRDFISIYKETRSVVIKTVIGLLFMGILVVFVLGVRHNVIVPK